MYSETAGRARYFFAAPEVLDGAHTRLKRAFAGEHPFPDWEGLEVLGCWYSLGDSALRGRRGDPGEGIWAVSKGATVVVTDLARCVVDRPG